MNILGLYWGLCSTAALVRDGEVVAAVSEERFTRRKNDDEFPRRSIDYLLTTTGLDADDLDGIAIASYTQGLAYTLRRTAHWSIADYIDEQHLLWYPRLYDGKDVSDLDVFADRLDHGMYPSDYWADLRAQEATFSHDREKIVARHLGIDASRVRRIEHHRCHAAYGFYSSPYRGEPVLALTVDGWGDGKNATINIVHADGTIENVFSTTECNIGRIYRYITLLLGMKPNEHEYKVMGLAPYAKPRITAPALEVFRSTLAVDGLDFVWKERPTDSYFWFRERLEGCRFDGIAAGLQQWTEELLSQWVSNAVQHFGIGKVVLSGGVAMNVKANAVIAAADNIESLFVGGSGADESMALSAGICLNHDLVTAADGTWAPEAVPYMENLCLGPRSDKSAEDQALQALDGDVFETMALPSVADLARLLLNGKVLARCVGRMEFGQRALGNRSILADPMTPGLVPRINGMIKNRDFWMPFAPIVMDRFADTYLVNPKDLLSPHMTIAFATTEAGWQAMPAGCHPADQSCRAQILTHGCNPDLYNLLAAFAAASGRGALLNTSFNLHGYPIVNTSAEAIDVLQRTDLDGLILNHYLILRRA